MEEEEGKKLTLFRQDISSIPCFRNSFLYGIGGGIATGLTVFMFTSRVRLSTHIGFTSFVGVTLTYWMYCRYNWSRERFIYRQLQEAMKQRAMYEGTELEEKIMSLEEADYKNA